MTLWLILTILTAAAAAIVTVPFLRRGNDAEMTVTGVDVYKDQLAEVERDKEQGLIDETEADLARIEIERRILNTARDAKTPLQTTPGNWRYQAVTGVAMIVVLGSVGLYATLGQHNLIFAQQGTQITAAGQATENTNAVQPAQATQMAGGNHKLGDVEVLVKRLEQRLKDNPNDPDGWRVLGWSYYNTGRYQDAVEAYRRAVDLQKDNSNVRALYGEALVRVAEGKVTDEALATFEDVLLVNPNDERARFFRGLAKEQKGDNQGALDDWITLYNVTPENAEWKSDLRQRIEEVSARSNIDVSQRLAEAKAAAKSAATPSTTAPPHPQALAPRGPTAEDIENAKQMSTDDQQAMVRGMVDRLASRLESSPSDADGWIMLIRSHIALNEQDKARAALERANKAFAAEPETQKRIAEAAQVMGVTLSK